MNCFSRISRLVQLLQLYCVSLCKGNADNIVGFTAYPLTCKSAAKSATWCFLLSVKFMLCIRVERDLLSPG